MAYRKNKFQKFIKRLLTPGLPKKPHLFRFSYYYCLRDFKKNSVRQEKLVLEDGRMTVSVLLEDTSKVKDGGEPIIVSKEERSVTIDSAFNSFYSFLREIKFHTIGSPSTHASLYPGSPTIHEVMELEVCKSKDKVPVLLNAFDSSELALDGENEVKFTKVVEYIENLKRNYLKTDH